LWLHNRYFQGANTSKALDEVRRALSGLMKQPELCGSNIIRSLAIKPFLS
jgi:hypothetical protein